MFAIHLHLARLQLKKLPFHYASPAVKNVYLSDVELYLS